MMAESHSWEACINRSDLLLVPPVHGLRSAELAATFGALPVAGEIANHQLATPISIARAQDNRDIVELSKIISRAKAQHIQYYCDNLVTAWSLKLKWKKRDLSLNSR